MLATSSADLSSTALGFKAFLESSYDNRNVVHVTAGSFVPLLKNSVWFVVRGMVKLGALSVHGDELVLGLVGPCLLYTSPSPRDQRGSRMPSSA